MALVLANAVFLRNLTAKLYANAT